MLKKLMSATALGVVMSAGAAMTAQAQATGPNPGPDCLDDGPFDVEDEDGVVLVDALGKPKRKSAGAECPSVFKA